MLLLLDDEVAVVKLTGVAAAAIDNLSLLFVDDAD
jgi:hypothetical protein